MVKINKNNYEFLCESDDPDYDKEDMKKDFYLKYDVKKVCYEDILNSSKPYPHWKQKEIMEQPETIKKAYNYGGRIENNIENSCYYITSICRLF